MIALEADQLYLLDRASQSPNSVLDIPWSKRKRIINEHHEMELYRARKQEEGARRVRTRRR